MSNKVTSENLMRQFPYALSIDDDKNALASAISVELQQLYNDDNRLIIYANINKLNEPLLDILANDFKVDWYLYDGTVETKQAQISSCFFILRHLGTKKAMIMALSDLCPGTDIEEWFEYGGLPYYFRIILDVTEQRLTISQDIVNNIVRVVKPARAVLEQDSIIYRSRNVLLMSEQNGYVFFNPRICGTYPKAAQQGKIQDLILLANGTGTVTEYTTARTGESQTGTIPSAATQGGIEGSNINFATNGASSVYSARVCGTPNGALL